MTESFGFRAAGRSDIGLARENNEDSGFIGKRFILVADGMGGHAAGELASSTAVAIIARLDSKKDLNDSSLTSITNSITKEIKNAISKDSSRTGMGTTLTSVNFTENQISITHVGDSRAYLIRNKEIKQLTKDHTYIQTLLDNGEINKEEAKTHPQRSMLLQAIDGATEVVADSLDLEINIGDQILVCSDGLTNVVSDNEILEIINKYEYVGAVSALIEKALENGAPDNVTIVLAEIIKEKIENSIVVLGAAAEPRNRIKLPSLEFPTEIHPFITSEFPALKAVKGFRKLITVMSVALLTIFLFWATNNWINKQFYVSNLGDNLAIFQGVNYSVGPISFSRPIQSFDLEAVVLTREDQKELRKGIDATSLTEARFIVRRLDQRALCARDASFSFCPDVINSIKPE